MPEQNTPQKPACRPLPEMSGKQVQRYRDFRRLLEQNKAALMRMAELEQLYHAVRPFTLPSLEREAGILVSDVRGMIESLDRMVRNGDDGLVRKTRFLFGILESIQRSMRDELRPTFRPPTHKLTLPLEQITAEKSRAVGAKAANLARLRSELALNVPRGFSITTAADQLFRQETGLDEHIEQVLADVSPEDVSSLEEAGRAIRARIMTAQLPSKLAEALRQAAEGLARQAGAPLLAVRSSAIGEDGEISFAGQYTSVLNVVPEDLVEAYKTVLASKYSTAALSYRLHHGLDDRETPMAALVLEMVNPRLSGVAYTTDPVGTDAVGIRINAVCGLGEKLVGGAVSPNWSWLLDKDSFQILEQTPSAGNCDFPDPDAANQRLLQELWRTVRRMEVYFLRPLDIEWAVDEQGRLFFLQARPLLIAPKDSDEETDIPEIFPDHPALITDGKCAAGGIAAGKVMLVVGADLDEAVSHVEPGTILVSRTASTMLTPLVGQVRGIVTDTGSTASHLASVAREYGVPALFDTGNATHVLTPGQEVTLWASKGRVYQGTVPELARGVRPVRRPVHASPVHLRMQRLLDLISPLHLTDPKAPEFNEGRCLTIHDIIRYCHEQSVREMFALGKAGETEPQAPRLKVSIPIKLFALDLGGGLRPGLTSCDEINAHDVASIPFQALWQGLSHPGLNWTSTIAPSARNFLSLVAGGAMSGPDDALGGPSYAFVADDYLNLNIRFGYHFATVDALCGDEPDHNYVSLHFAGGVASYFGRSLRIQYMAAVLKRLGYAVTVQGDLIEASLKQADEATLRQALDQTGRLLGTSRLLDMALHRPEQVMELAESFFAGKYDFLEPARPDAPDGYYLITGHWRTAQGEEQAILQDGSGFTSLSAVGMAKAMTRLIGKRYQEFLDTIEAYYYFPLAIAKESLMESGTASVRVKPVSGHIDQAGGLAFGIRDWDNYFVFRINALEDNAILFEFRNGKRLQRQEVEIPIAAGFWHDLRVENSDGEIRAYLNDSRIMTHQPDRPMQGYVGLWTKADSVTLFKKLHLQKMPTG